jgi:sugar lactone lactonase YvrE
MNKKKLLALTTFLTASSLSAVTVQRVTVGTFDDFAQGEPLSATLTQPGVLKSGATLKEIFDLKDLNIWSGVADADGDLYVGTGPKGEVFRVHAGEATQVAKFEESDVYAVARNASGEIFAASSPKGKIYRFADGHAEEYFNTGEEYVWDLLFDAAGNLYAATGGKGKIFKITEKGKGEVWYASDEPNIRCLAFDKTGNLLAGTSGKGLLYRVTAKDQAVVLLQAAYAEITAITVSGDTIYAAATGKRDLKSAPAPATTITVSGTNGGEAVRAMAAAISARATSAGAPASVSTPSASDKSVLYRLQRDLYPEIVARADNSIYSLAPTKDGILIGTGGNGKLYRFNTDEQLELIGKVEAKDITRLLPRADSDQLTVLTSNLAKGLALGVSGGEGVYQSKVFDTGLFAQWGALEVTGSGKWRVQTRSGNTENPDKSWYPWIGLKNAHSQSPPARYTQFKLTVSEGEVWRVEFAYLPQNQPPTLSAPIVLVPGLGSKEMPAPVNSGPRTTNLDQLLKGGPVIPPAQPSQYQLSNTPGWRTVAWKATDPNGDTLQYQVEIRAEAQRDWDVLAEKLDKSIFSWDASGWADGNYYIRVTADDAPDNKQGKSHTAQKTSEVFQIDNTPPKITVLAQDDEYVDIRVTDALSRIGSVRISTNARDYAEVQPKDGLTDSRQEEYRVKREKDQPLYLRATDSAGNVAGLRIEKNS